MNRRSLLDDDAAETPIVSINGGDISTPPSPVSSQESPGQLGPLI